jgi:hypothetical protein
MLLNHVLGNKSHTVLPLVLMVVVFQSIHRVPHRNASGKLLLQSIELVAQQNVVRRLVGIQKVNAANVVVLTSLRCENAVCG